MWEDDEEYDEVDEDLDWCEYCECWVWNCGCDEDIYEPYYLEEFEEYGEDEEFDGD